MILRRISENVKSQNWFAVAIDFLIVVVGVFMGLQVQDWNDARKERIEERDLLSRLYEEALELLEVQRQELVGLRARADVLMGVNTVLFAQEPTRDISAEECANIVSSHLYRRPPDELPVMDEMLATGRFDVLQDKAVKEQLRNYVLFRGRSRAHFQEATNELFRLHSRFPGFISIGRVAVEAGYSGPWSRLSGEGFRWNHACSAEKMRASSAFLNEYVDNLSRIGSQIQFTQQRQQHLEELKAVLSTSLDVASTAD